MNLRAAKYFAIGSRAALLLFSVENFGYCQDIDYYGVRRLGWFLQFMLTSKEFRANPSQSKLGRQAFESMSSRLEGSPTGVVGRESWLSSGS